MPIELKESEVVTIPARKEVVLDKLWIRSIVIQTPSPLTEGAITLEYGVWSGDRTADAVWRDGDGNDIAKTIAIPDIYATMAECPELYTVFAAIIGSIKPMEAYLEAKAVRIEKERLASEEAKKASEAE